MHLLFIMDTPDTVILDEDTSYALMLEAQEQGHQVSHCLITDLFLEASKLCARIRPATMKRDPKAPVILGDAQDCELEELDVVFVRKDPPFDSNYLWAALLLDHLKGKTLVVNDPLGLRDANEKLYGCNFPQFMPETLVSNDANRIKAFMDKLGSDAVIKPIDGAGGSGVMALRKGDLNLNSIIELSTDLGRRLVMAQRMLPEVKDGDKRILVVDGEALGAILRVPQSDELRSNIHVGGHVVAAEISDQDQKIIEGVAPRLKKDGLFFVGLDVIGEYLTEINVTSPTGIQQMSRLMNQNLSKKVIDALSQKVQA